MTQLMPSMVRMCCRSGFTFIEDELIVYMVNDAIRKLENYSSSNAFNFIDRHLFILHHIDPETIRAFVRERQHYGKQSMMPFCRFAIDGKIGNAACCSCSHVKEIIEFIEVEYGEKRREYEGEY